MRTKNKPSTHLMGRNLYEKKYGYMYITPVVAVLALISIVPMVSSIYMSLTDISLVSSGSTKFIGLSNYINILLDGRFWASVCRSVIYVTCVVSVELAIGFFLALMFQIEFPAKRVMRSIIMLPMVATPIAVAFLWRIMYNPKLGIMNYLIGLLNLPPLEWASSEKTALLSTMLIDVWQWTPFIFLIMSSGLASLPLDPIEAAIVDGASFFQIIRQVVLPLIKPVLFIGLLFRVVDSFKAFDTIYVLTAGGPGTATETINVLVFLKAFKHFDMGTACAMSIIMVYLVLFICNFFVKKGELNLH